MGTMVYSLLWVMQDFYHQPYCYPDKGRGVDSSGICIKPEAKVTGGLAIRPRFGGIFTANVFHLAM